MGNHKKWRIKSLHGNKFDIDFEELELESASGNIGIKVSSNEVAILPNRERLQWNDVTRKTIVDRFRQAGAAATKVLTESLNQTNFADWFRAANSIIGYRRSGLSTSTNWKAPGAMTDRIGIVRVLSEMRLITKTPDSHPEFSPKPGFKYSHLLDTMFPGIDFRLVRFKRQTGKRKLVGAEAIERIEADMVDDLFEHPVYVISGGVSFKLDEQVLEQLHPQGFIIAKVKERYIGEAPLTEIAEELEEENETLTPDGEKEQIKIWRKQREKLLNDAKTGIELLIPLYPKYEEIKVDKTVKLQTGKDPDKPTAEELRKLEQRIVIRTPRTDGKWGKAEPEIGALEKITKPLYYGLGDDEQLGLVRLAADIITRNKDHYVTNHYEKTVYTVGRSWSTYILTDEKVVANNAKMIKHATKMGMLKSDKNPTALTEWRNEYAIHWLDPKADVLLASIAEENLPYFADRFYHITEFFNKFEDGVLTMNELLIKWNTARLLNLKLTGIDYMNGMGTFNSKMHLSYLKLKAYTDKYYHHVNAGELKNAIIKHMDRVTTLQEFIRDNSGDEEVVRKVATEMFGSNGELITGAKAVELDLVDEANALIEWAKPIHEMMKMNNIIQYNMTLSQDQEEAIRQYIAWRTS